MKTEITLTCIAMNAIRSESILKRDEAFRCLTAGSEKDRNSLSIQHSGNGDCGFHWVQKKTGIIRKRSSKDTQSWRGMNGVLWLTPSLMKPVYWMACHNSKRHRMGWLSQNCGCIRKSLKLENRLDATLMHANKQF